MKRILFILISLTGGGAEKVFIDMLRNFNYKKYKVTLLLMYGDGLYISKIPKEVELIVLFNHPQRKRDIRFAYLFRNVFQRWLKYNFNKKINGKDFDVVISYTEGFPVLMQSFIKGENIKRIAWTHIDMESSHWCWWHFKSKKQEKTIYEGINEIVFVSENAKEKFSNAFDIKKNLRVIYNVIERDAIVEKSKLESVRHEKFTICNVGRLNPQKRQERVIQVASELQRRGYDFEVWILGIGHREKELKELVAHYNLEEHVKFLGFKENPYPYIAASDLFLLTSDAEGYPTVVCESLCLGVPVVSTKVTGTDELLGDGTGILTSFDIHEITDRVEEIIISPELHHNYVEMSLRKSMKFNPKDVIKQIEHLI